LRGASIGSLKSGKSTHRGRPEAGSGGDVFFCNREGKIREEVRIERV
jgi:hypothetical protein